MTRNVDVSLFLPSSADQSVLVHIVRLDDKKKLAKLRMS